MDLTLERSYPTPFANVSLLPMLLFSLMQQKHSPQTSIAIKKEYDFIIVGAGSAGSVLANRLSEMPCVSVLLLEAGGPPPLLTEIPAIERVFWNTDIDWSFKTVPQKHTGAGLKNRQIVWPSGKTLGGSSVLNDGIYNRGNRKNYDDWAANGAEGWSYDEVLPYFKKLEENMDPEYISNGYHGTEGETTIHRPRYRSEYKAALFKAIRKLGYKVVDPNAHRHTGFYDHQGTLRNSQMCSTAKAYLVPAENRTNLDILPKAMVRKIVIENHTALGVQFDFQGKTYVVKSRKEVIVSAGTANTPKLLMLSGIGPRKELKRHRIPIIAELPVGENLQDHIGSNLNFLLKSDIPEVHEKLINPFKIAQYIQNRTGPLASTQFITALGFLENVDKPHTDFPDYKLYFAESSATLFPLLSMGLKREVFKKLYGPYIGRPFYTCFAHLLQPRSRGKITLASADPYDDPVIDPNYFDDPDDIKDIIEGLKTCMKIGTSKAMRKIGSEPFATLHSGCEKFYGNDELYYWCQIKSVAFSFFHPVGTAKMGHLDDPTTVVDPQLRVKGIENLRVVDASIMPVIPSGDINIPVIMVAEKASDMIKSTVNCHWTTTQENNIDHNSYVQDDDVDQPDYDSYAYDDWINANKDDADETIGWNEAPLEEELGHDDWSKKESPVSKQNKNYFEQWNNGSPTESSITDEVQNSDISFERNTKENYKQNIFVKQNVPKSTRLSQSPKIFVSNGNQTTLPQFLYSKEHSTSHFLNNKSKILNMEKQIPDYSLDQEQDFIAAYQDQEHETTPEFLEQNQKLHSENYSDQEDNFLTTYPEQKQQPTPHSSEKEHKFPSKDYSDQEHKFPSKDYSDQGHKFPSKDYSDQGHKFSSKDYSDQEHKFPSKDYLDKEHKFPSKDYSDKEHKFPSKDYSDQDKNLLIVHPEQQPISHSSDQEHKFPFTNYSDEDENLLIVYPDQEKQSLKVISDAEYKLLTSDYSDPDQSLLQLFEQEKNLLAVYPEQIKNSSFNSTGKNHIFSLHSSKQKEQSLPYFPEVKHYYPIHPKELEKQFEPYSANGRFKTLSQQPNTNKQPNLPCAKKHFRKIFRRRNSQPEKSVGKVDPQKHSISDSVKLSAENFNKTRKIGTQKEQRKSYSTLYSSYDIKVPIKRKLNKRLDKNLD